MKRMKSLNQTWVFGLSAATAAALIACGEARELEPLDLMAPVSLDEQVVWVEQSQHRAFLLDVMKKEPVAQVREFELPENTISVRRRAGANELLLLAGGEDNDAGELAVVGPKGVDRSYSLETRFDALVQSPDGRYAIAYFSPGGGEGGSFLFNPNEVAIVDLEAPEKEGVFPRTLRSIGSTPKEIHFSPPMEVAGKERRFAVVLFDTQVSLMDMTNLEAPEFTVELSTDSNLRLNQVRFSPDEQKIYLLGAGSNDIYVLKLSPAGANRINEYEPSLNQLGASSRPTDMKVYRQGSETRLLAVGPAGALVIEAGSNRVTTVPLERPAGKILLFEGTAPFDDDAEQRALLYATGQRSVTFLDLDQVEERKTRNLERIDVGKSVTSLTELANGVVLLLHSDQGLSLLNLQERTSAPISAKVNLSDAIPSLELNRLWVPAFGGTTLGYLDLTNFHPSRVELDQPISEVLLFGNETERRVVINHPSSSGSVTILDAEEPDNERAQNLRGFFYTGLLD